MNNSENHDKTMGPMSILFFIDVRESRFELHCADPGAQ